MLQLIWYYRTSWVSNKGALVSVLIFWFAIIKSGWYSVVRIIASNFLKIGNVWTIAVKYATNVVYVGTHFFIQFPENSRSQSNACNNLISSTKTHQLNGKGIHDSTETMTGVTDEHQNCEKCEWSDWCIKK